MKYKKATGAILTIALVLMTVLTGCYPTGNTDSSLLPSGTGAQTIINVKQVNVSQSGETDPDTKAMTRQEICEQVMPSVVYLVNVSDGAAMGAGSGIIMSEDGYILTNAHVVEDADLVSVTFYDGRNTEALLVGIDVLSDLAVIRISDTSFDLTSIRPATFGVSEDLRLGDSLVVLGNPGGETFSFSATFGYVSAMHRAIETEDGYTINCIQTDAAINPGNSGGALVNEYGLVVGINSSKIAATEYEGLGFAIEIDEALKIIPELIEHGYIEGRPSLGVSVTFGQFYDNTATLNQVLRSGVQITAISSASQNDLKVYDIITQIDGVEITSANIFYDAVKNKNVGDTVTLQIYRATRSGGSFWGSGYKYTYTVKTVTATIGDYAELYS